MKIEEVKLFKDVDNRLGFKLPENYNAGMLKDFIERNKNKIKNFKQSM